MPLQIIGSTLGAAEIETNTRAIRTVIRPNDYGALGSYSLTSEGGDLNTTGFTAALSPAPVFSFRWADASRLAVINRVGLDMYINSGSSNQATVSAKLFVARSWTTNDTAGTAVVVANKLRSGGMNPSLVTQVMIAGATVLTAGTRTKDAQPIASMVSSMALTSSNETLTSRGRPPVPVFEARMGEYPVVLGQNEGLVLELSTDDTFGSAPLFAVTVTWDELAAY